jgi:hypothetical protein
MIQPTPLSANRPGDNAVEAVPAKQMDLVVASVADPIPKKRKASFPSNKEKWHQLHCTKLSNGFRKCNYCELVIRFSFFDSKFRSTFG